MSRVQLALNVDDLDAAVAFYTALFDTEPAKRRPGYANFAVADPPLKLVLIENAEEPAGTLNHLGVEVETTEEVTGARDRLSARGLPTATEDQVACCYAVQDKVWVDGPGGEPWEVYTVLADVDASSGADDGTGAAPLRSADPSGAACCATRPDLALAGSGTSPDCC